MTEIITSNANRQVKNVIALAKSAKERDAQDLFIVEGPKMFLEAPPERVTQVYVSESFHCGPLWAKIRDRAGRILERAPLAVVSDPVFARMSDTRTPQGVLCLIRRFHYDPADLLAPGRPALIMILENLQDPGNLGTIVRSGEGAGVTGILLGGETADIYNPKVIRSTMGSIYRVPFARTGNLGGALREMKRSGIRLCAAHLAGKNAYDRESYTGPCGFMIGNESKGLTDETSALADVLVRIPMLGQVESLNAAMAAGIMMFEAARQRREQER